MIQRLYIKNHLSFDEVELKFDKGLSVFSGVSGAGKSVLMNSLLGVFALSDCDAKLVEADVEFDFNLDEFGILKDDMTNFRMLKDKTTRYFLNSQAISKKNVSLIAQEHIKFLGAKAYDELSSENLRNLLDLLICKFEDKYKNHLSNLKDKFLQLSKAKKELKEIEEKESKIEELKEFAKFEIDKIEQISPKIGEYEELLELKKKLSVKDKLLQSWQDASAIFNYENKVLQALELAGIDSAFFQDCMDELRSCEQNFNFDELEELDIENILDRISALSSLNKRYGGISEALDILNKRKDELSRYEKIEFEKEELAKKVKTLSDESLKIAQIISKFRIKFKDELQDRLNSYLKDLYMPNLSVEISAKQLDSFGIDEVEIVLNGANFKNLSSGENNRLRLAFIAVSLDLGNANNNNVLILDEIDANLSGKEAMSIANVLLKISKYYQIFAISHQPQLSSVANSHFLVSKKDGISSVKKLTEDEKIEELARMISGDNISNEALEFAKKLRNL